MTDITAWVGSEQSQTARIDPGLDAELRGVLGLPADGSGALLHGLHWLVFDRFAPASATGVDGHPRRGGFLPPIELPRRMWAGGRLEFLQPIEEGDTLTRNSRVESVTRKEGRAGELVFVTVSHEVHGASGLLIKEEQDLVYLDIAPAKPRGAAVELEERTPLHTAVTPDEVMLFRYSALTRNSHRIHYDAEYAREVELYPALVVHGPLTATLLMWFSAQCAGERPLRSFSFRGQSPLYVGDAVRLEAAASDQGYELVARNPADGVGMSAAVGL